MPVEQIRVGFDNFCYIIYCSTSKKTAIVDHTVAKSVIVIESNAINTTQEKPTAKVAK